MRILFLHDNFPAQFGAFGQHLAKSGWDVLFGTQRKGAKLPGVNTFTYEPHRAVTEKIHPYAAGYERAVLTGQAVARACLSLKKNGYAPDIIMAHSGWGPGMFVKDIWPDAKYVGYFEWFYRGDAPDVAFLEGEPMEINAQLRARARNAALLADLAACDAGICPTGFQKAQFPACFHDKLTVRHDGIDTDYYAPAPGAQLELPGVDLSGAKELVTYVARGMEPYRGFPEFMKALEPILKDRPSAHAVIVGEDRVAYGRKLPEGDSYKKRTLRECDLDWGRVHFTGLLPRNQYRAVLQASTVHSYLTIPFVLSWSMMEAMSAGCAIVASDVAPVRELSDQATGALRLTPLKADEIARSIVDLLRSPETRRRQGQVARAVIENHYAAKALYEEKIAFLTSLLDGRTAKDRSQASRGFAQSAANTETILH